MMTDSPQDVHESSESVAHQESKTVVVEHLDEEAQLKLDIIHSLLEPCDRITYGDKLRDAAEKLGCSVRTVQRLVKKWEIEGTCALVSTSRSDRGKHRISEFWQDFIVKTYKDGNKGSRRMKPKQVAIRVQAKAREIGDPKPPSYKTVLRIIKPIIERKEAKKKIRSPGWQGSTLSLKTRKGDYLAVESSNHVWQCDHTKLDVLLVDQHDNLLGRPWLTTVIDTYSRCIMGFNLGFDGPSSDVVALALRHAILPKNYGADYKLNCDWGTYGTPTHFYTDGGSDFCSNHLKQIASNLGFTCHLRDRPSEGGIVERPFRTFNDQLLSTFFGYTGSNVQQRPKDAEKDACFRLIDVERLVARFICDTYNQSIDARTGDQTRFQRWEAGLPNVPDAIDERHLDICFMRENRRKVERGGYIRFKNLMFQGEYLAAYAGEIVSLRFNPNDITTLLIYRYEDGRDVFLTRAFAKGLETERLSLKEVEESSKRIREAGKTLCNASILQEAVDRDALIQKKSRKQRQKAEQVLAKPQPKPLKVESTEAEPMQEEPEVEVALDTAAFEAIDFDDLRGGW